jgi:hypothetical protein
MASYLVYLIGFAFLVTLGWLVFLTAKYRQLLKRAGAIFDDSNPQKLAATLKEYFKNIEEVNENHEKLQRVIVATRKTADLGLTRVGFLRYNPFGDIGSDQSFSMCLLNNALDGFVISSIHSREGTRVYSKLVQAGSSPYNLSAEEEKVIKMAIGNAKKENNK